MDPVTRRNMLRLAGGATTAGLVGASAVAPAHAARTRVQARLKTDVVEVGGLLTLHISENLRQGRRIRVRDRSGLEWKRVIKRRRYEMWTARATTVGAGTVTAVVKRADGKVFRKQLDYSVVGSQSTNPTALGAAALIGMSAMPDQWSQKISEVGPGVSARRIFADLASGPTTQLKLVEEAHEAGMLPVISYKVGGDVSGAIAGRFNAAAEQAAARLASYGKPTAVTIWHEPYKDMSGAQFAAMHQRLMPLFKRDQLKVGPILNGWLLDNQVAAFESFCPDPLFDLWDYFAIDTYESGTMASPGEAKPGDRIPALSSYLRSRGHDLPIGVGEYNGYSAATIRAAGEALLSTPNVWFGCLWNVTGGVGHELTGDRLEAFRGTLADPRAGRVA
ncbi:hypothetical protein [Nocardioides lacusdianchii]|uniref:hypothetical protein n=1 Tax=Nocardioides lacusdianchii TaxID=2783664 RepID=UPI001CCCCE90|nr:hypothetical protein [Nocardioides lacusdianchii]